MAKRKRQRETRSSLYRFSQIQGDEAMARQLHNAEVAARPGRLAARVFGHEAARVARAERRAAAAVAQAERVAAAAAARAERAAAAATARAEQAAAAVEQAAAAAPVAQGWAYQGYQGGYDSDGYSNDSDDGCEAGMCRDGSCCFCCDDTHGV